MVTDASESSPNYMIFLSKIGDAFSNIVSSSRALNSKPSEFVSSVGRNLEYYDVHSMTC